MSREYTRPIFASILAGAQIGFGALFMLAARSQGYSPLVGGLCFAAGLYMVVRTKSMLFTGQCIRVSEVLSGRLPIFDYATTLVVALFGNFAGAIFLVALVNLCGLEFTALPAIAGAKLESDLYAIFWRGFACNLLVCLAVWMAGKSEEPAFSILATVPIFVVCSFEHSIADMTILRLNGGCPQAGFIILVSIFGNLLGGILMGYLKYRIDVE